MNYKKILAGLSGAAAAAATAGVVLVNQVHAAADAALVNAATDGLTGLKENAIGVFSGTNVVIIVVATAAVAIGARFLPGMVRKLFGR